MNVSPYLRRMGEELPTTLEEAVLEAAPDLALDGLRFSDQTLLDAARSADIGSNPVEVKLPGVALFVEQGKGTFAVTGVVACA